MTRFGANSTRKIARNLVEFVQNLVTLEASTSSVAHPDLNDPEIVSQHKVMRGNTRLAKKAWTTNKLRTVKVLS